MPDRTHGVDDVLCREPVPLGDFGVARLATVQSPAFCQELRPGGPVNGPIYTASTEQRRIGRVDDSVDVLAGNISLNNPDSLSHISLHGANPVSFA